MNTNTFTLRVARFDPLYDSEPSYRNYEIPFDGSMSVLMALEYVYEYVDETLAFRRYCCGTARCNSCLMVANGKKIRACSILVEEGKTLVVEPAEGYRVIKDLVVDFDDRDASVTEVEEVAESPLG
jgi:succinate dehydrogenase/fumarate reductase-like Fe-S protein